VAAPAGPGRVPPDALLDATGALAAGLAVAALVSPVSGGFAAARRG
jgi:hypothetical protein